MMINIKAGRGRPTYDLPKPSPEAPALNADLPVSAVAIVGLLLAPGPTNALLAAAGANLGLRRALPLVACEAAGYGLAILVLRGGLGPLIDVAPSLGAALRLACAAWLAWTAVRLWRAGAAGIASATPVTGSSVFLATALNPKALVLAYGILPAGAAWGLAESGILAIGALAGGMSWVALGAAIGRRVDHHAGRAHLNRAAAAVMAVFAGLVSASALGG